jgi:hypothetical protein
LNVFQDKNVIVRIKNAITLKEKKELASVHSSTGGHNVKQTKVRRVRSEMFYRLLLDPQLNEADGLAKCRD